MTEQVVDKKCEKYRIRNKAGIIIGLDKMRIVCRRIAWSRVEYGIV